MSVNQAAHPIATMGRVLDDSAIGCCAWQQRAASRRAQADAALLARVRTIPEHSRGTYGMPQVHAELKAEGTRVSRKRVARLMRAASPTPRITTASPVFPDIPCSVTETWWILATSVPRLVMPPT